MTDSKSEILINQKFWFQYPKSKILISKLKNKERYQNQKFWFQNSKFQNPKSEILIPDQKFWFLQFFAQETTFETCEHRLHEKKQKVWFQIRNSDFKTQNLKTQNQKFWFQNHSDSSRFFHPRSVHKSQFWCFQTCQHILHERNQNLCF